MSTPPHGAKEPTLEGYTNSLPLEINACILVDHCVHGKLQKRPECEGLEKEKVSSRFRYYTKQQKKDSGTYYKLFAQAKEIVEKLEKKNNKEDAKTTPDDDNDDDYVPKEDKKTDSKRKRQKTVTLKPHLPSAPKPSLPSTASKMPSTPGQTASTTNAAAPDVSDSEVDVDDINSLIKNKCLVKENILVTKPYYKYEEDSDRSRYKRMHYAIVVFAFTQEDAKAVKFSFPLGDSIVRVDKPNLTSLFYEFLEEVAEELFCGSPFAQEAIRETILSGVLKQNNVVDLKFPIDLLQSISGRAIPIVRLNEDQVCSKCGYNLKALVLAHVVEVAANKRTKVHGEDMETLVRDRGALGSGRKKKPPPYSGGSPGPMSGGYGSPTPGGGYGGHPGGGGYGGGGAGYDGGPGFHGSGYDGAPGHHGGGYPFGSSGYGSGHGGNYGSKY